MNPKPQRCNRGFKTQIVLCPEVTLWACFGSRNITKTLQFFEGKGAFVKANLYSKYEYAFEDCNWFICSNDLPNAIPGLVSHGHWAALETRINVVELAQKHVGKTFPYEAEHLAYALRHLENENAVKLTREYNAAQNCAEIQKLLANTEDEQQQSVLGKGAA